MRRSEDWTFDEALKYTPALALEWGLLTSQIDNYST